jgi:hypothetical protein
MTQQLLPSSETSLWITSVTDLAHREKQINAVPRLLKMFSRVKSNRGKYTLCNMTCSLDHTGCKTSFNIASDSLHEIKIALQTVTESNESLVTHNLTLMLNHSCRQKYVVIERLVIDYNETKVEIHSMNDNILQTEPEEFQLFKYYIDPALYLVVLIVGLIGNDILLFMFVRHRKIRTRSNIIIINLVVCDLVNLTLSIPLHYFFKYGHTLRHSVTFCRTVFSAWIFFRSMSAFAVVSLNIQRCNTITSSLKPPCRPTGHKIRTVTSTALWILSVWLLPLAIALPSALVKDFYNWHCFSIGDEHFVKIMVVISVLLYCVLLPVADQQNQPWFSLISLNIKLITLSILYLIA